MMIASYGYGDIVIGEMMYTDHSAVKKRPLLILAHHGDDYVVAFITSQESEYKDTSYRILMDATNNLRDDSYVLLHKITTVHETLLGKKLGELILKQKAEIKQRYINYFQQL